MALLEESIAPRAICTPNVGEFLTMLRGGNLIPTLLQFRWKYGDAILLSLAGRNTFILFHPEDVREVLVAQAKNFHKGAGVTITNEFLGDGLVGSDGEFHKRHRRMIQPAFHRQRILGYANTMVEVAKHISGLWRDGASVSMVEEMMHFTFFIVGRTLFNFDVTEDAPAVQRSLDVAMEAFVKVGSSPLAKELSHLPLPVLKRMRQARADLDVMLNRAIAQHRASEVDQGDALSALLAVQDEDGSSLSDDDIRDEVLTLLMAGHETTANWLAWTWYALAEHPEIEVKLHEELDSVLGDADPTFEHISRLPYTEKVLMESLRVYPPVWAVDREAIADTEVNGISIPKGARVIVSQYVAHRDPRFFTNPDRFDPDRWTPEMKAARPKFSFFPFGGGTRLCIGESFAWTEAMLGLALFARHWAPRLVPGQTPQLDPAVTLRPHNGMPMTLHARKP